MCVVSDTGSCIPVSTVFTFFFIRAAQAQGLTLVHFIVSSDLVTAYRSRLVLWLHTVVTIILPNCSYDDVAKCWLLWHISLGYFQHTIVYDGILELIYLADCCLGFEMHALEQSEINGGVISVTCKKKKNPWINRCLAHWVLIYLYTVTWTLKVPYKQAESFVCTMKHNPSGSTVCGDDISKSDIAVTWCVWKKILKCPWMLLLCHICKILVSKFCENVLLFLIYQTSASHYIKSYYLQKKYIVIVHYKLCTDSIGWKKSMFMTMYS